MPLPPVVEDLNTIPEPLRAAYVQREGKYVLDTDADAHPSVQALKNAYERVKQESQQHRERLKQFGDVDPQTVQQLLREREEAEQKRAAAAGEFEKLKTQLVERHQTELKKVQDRAKLLEDALYHALAESAAVKEIVAAKGSATLLLPHVRKHIRVIEDESATDIAERFRAVVVDAKGTPRVGDANGTPMSIAALVAELRDNPEFAGAFMGSGSSGSGATGTTTAGPAGTVRTRADLKSDKEKSDFIAKHGYEAFVKLPAK